MIRLVLIGDECAEQYAAAAARLGNVEVRPVVKDDLSRAALKDVDAVVIEMPCDEHAIDVCHEMGVRLVVGNASRYLPSLHAVKASLDAGQLGEPGLLRIHRWESRKVEQDDMPLAQVACEVDVALWLFGVPPTQVYARGRNDYVQFHLGFPNDASALIDYSAALPPGEDFFSLSMIGSRGAAYADDHHNMQLLYRGGQPSSLKTRESQAVLTQLREIVAAIEEGRDPPISVAETRAALQVVEAATQSAVSAGNAAHRKGEAYELV